MSSVPGVPYWPPGRSIDRLVQQGEVEAVGTAGEDWMGAPLKVEGRMIGVMAVQSYTQGSPFRPGGPGSFGVRLHPGGPGDRAQAYGAGDPQSVIDR